MNGDQIVSVGRSGEEQRDVMPMDENIEVIVQRAEKQVDTLNRILKIAVARTNQDDWVDQQGKPYLTASGAEKLMPLFGISLENANYERNKYQDEEGEYYIYQYKGRFFWKGGSIEAIGACSSRDKFFAWNSAERTYKPLGQVDECNIMKAAYSNMLMNGITRLLGIRNLTWEQLKDMGKDPSKAHRVSYGGRGKATDEETKRQNEISQWCMEMSYGDKQGAIRLLQDATKFTGKDGKEVAGVTSTKALRNTRLNIAHNKIKNLYEEFKGAEENSGEATEQKDFNQPV